MISKKCFSILSMAIMAIVCGESVRATPVLTVSDLQLDVNTTTGDVQLDTTVSGGLPIAGYQIQSASSSLVGANLHSISSADSSFFVFISTNSNISEGSFGTYTLNPSFDLGNIFNVTGTHDLTFEWLDASSNSYSGAPVIYTAVPEPATIGLFLMAGMGGLLLIRRRKAA